MNTAVKRLFFACMPDVEMRQALVDLQFAHVPEKARAVSVGNIHLTLHFLGNVDEVHIESLIQAGSGIKGKSFGLQFDYIASFHHSGILYAGCKAAPQALQSLQHELQIISQPFHLYQEAREYLPHVTLARKCYQHIHTVLPAAIHWDVNAFSLISSENRQGGVVYHSLAKWTL